MKFEIAMLSDVADLCKLLDLLFEQEVEFKPDLKAQIIGLELIINNPNAGTIIVARDNSELIGMINILYTVSTALGARVGMLEDMVVTKSARDCGVGSKLIEFALEYALNQGCKRMTLLTDHDNEAAHRFYQKHGFSRSSMVPFRKSMGDKPHK
jgi:GNAT superfamily N-acetyltransferase